MKKLLEILGTITITSSAVLTVIAAAPNRKQTTKTKLLNSELNFNYLQTNNLENLNRIKRDVDDEWKISNENNEIGEDLEDDCLGNKQHKNFFLKLTSIFWKEIINLYESSKSNFPTKLEEKIKNQFKKYFEKEERLSNYILENIYSLCKSIYENWHDINNQWKKSSKNKRIKICFKNKTERESASWDAISQHYYVNLDPDNGPFCVWNEEVAAAAQPRTWSYSYYVSSNIIDYNKNSYEKVFESTSYSDNEKINELKKDFEDFNKDSIDIGIVDNDDDETILGALHNQNQNLKISELEVIDKTPYSHITKMTSAKIKIKSESKYNYPKIILKPKLLFISKIKIKELSDQIKKEAIFQNWEKNILDWIIEINRQIKQDIPKYGDDERGQALKRTWKGNHLTELNNKLLSLNHILETIDSKFKLSELGNGISLTIKDLNNNIDDLIKNINEIKKEIWKIKNPDSNFFKKEILPYIKTLINKNTKLLKLVYKKIPVISDIAMCAEAIIYIFSAINGYNNNISKYDIIILQKSQEYMFNFLDNKERSFDYSFKKE